MANFGVVEGRKSPLYNHFAEYELMSCRATVTRLMGVVALKLCWQDASDASRRYYQLMHLDYSEYGIDEYLEFECLPEGPGCRELRAEVQARWNRFINVMGGAAVSITPSCALRLIDSALSLAGDDVPREHDSEENKSFRRFAAGRLSLMTEALRERGIDSDACSIREAIASVSVPDPGPYGIINYFLMRLLDRDFDAASFLSDIPEEELRKSPLASRGIQSLMRSDITDVPKRYNPRADDRLSMYYARITTLSRDGYYHITLSIWLDPKKKGRAAPVRDIEIGTETLLSNYEAAIQIARSEYITVFDCGADVTNSIESMHLRLLSRADRAACENGLLYTIYNETNDHVERASYMLSDDVYGYALLSLSNELVLMSTDLDRITAMDEELLLSILSPRITVKGRFKMEVPIFHTLCHGAGLSFDDLVDQDD